MGIFLNVYIFTWMLKYQHRLAGGRGEGKGESRNKQRGISNFSHPRLCGHLLKCHKSSEMTGWMFGSPWCQLADFPHELTSCLGIFQEQLWFNLNYLEVIIPLVAYQGLCFLSISFLGTCFLKPILILINSPNLGKGSSVYFNKHLLNVCHVPSIPLAARDRKRKRSGWCPQRFEDLIEKDMISKQCYKKKPRVVWDTGGASSTVWGSQEWFFKKVKIGLSFKEYRGINKLTKSEKRIGN